MSNKKFEVKITLSNVDDEQLGQVLSMLATMQHLGRMGGGRWIKFYADGDGAFHPRIDVEGITDEQFDGLRSIYGKWNDKEEFVIVTD